MGLKSLWQEFKASEPGRRFRDRYRHRAEQRDRGERQLGRPIVLILAAFFALVAIPLMFTPGPAFIFWGLAGFLVAGESVWTARTLDGAELVLRRGWRNWKKRRARGKPPGLHR